MAYPNYNYHVNSLGASNVIRTQNYHYQTAPRENIFESHSTYKKQYVQPSRSANQSKSTLFPRYGKSPSPSNLNLDLLRPQQTPMSFTPNNHLTYKNYPLCSTVPQGIDTEEQYLNMQRVNLERVRDAVRDSNRQLAEIEHETLTKSNELECLLNVEKNPTQEDVLELRSEICEINRSLQNLCDELDHVIAASPTKHHSSSQAMMTKRSFDSGYTNKVYSLESPTTKLLRNPIDNSLVCPGYDFY